MTYEQDRKQFTMNGDQDKGPKSSRTSVSKSLNKCNSPKEQSNDNYITKNKKPLVITTFSIDKDKFATEFQITTTVSDIKKRIIDVLEVEEDSLNLKVDIAKFEESQTLANLGAEAYSRIQFQLSPTRGEEGRTKIISSIRENIPTINVLTVHIREGEESRNIVVEIENQCSVKEWLGGFRNKVTHVEYHHAKVQTARNPRIVVDSVSREPLMYHRDSQTPFYPKWSATSTAADRATQTYRADLYVSALDDKISSTNALTWNNSASYETKDIFVKAALTIQKAFRNWSHYKKFISVIKFNSLVREDIRKQGMQILKDEEDEERAIITGAAFPVKRDDFYMLYLMVGSWWKKEWKTIDESRFTEGKIATSILLLKKEIQQLTDIEKHRISGKNEALNKQNMKSLQLASRPLTFVNSNGKMVSIDNLETQRAREFKELYSELIRTNTLPKERVGTLIAIKQLFESIFMDYEYANDLVNLIVREIDLLSIGTKLKDLLGLHKRIEQLFLNFTRQEKFNPKVAKSKTLGIPKMIGSLLQCTRCKKMLPKSKFPVHVRLKKYSECKSCNWLRNIGSQRVDMSPYLKLLKTVRNSEMEKCCNQAVCFILQPIGMSHLTNVIWHGCSAISECSDISKLVHVRWLSNVEWAPWNTILLTNQEAKCHRSITNVFKFYAESFFEKVRQKHILARICFVSLLKMNHNICKSGVWANIKDAGDFLHPSHAENFALKHENDWENGSF